MNKYFLLILLSLIGFLTSCSDNGSDGEGDYTTVTVNLPEQVIASRASSAAFANPSMQDMRVALIVSTNQKVVLVEEQTGHDFGTDGKSAAIFKVRLVKGQSYDITAWADFGNAYYTLPTPPAGAVETSNVDPVVKLTSLTRDASTQPGSYSKYDCYFKNENKTITANQKIYLELKRPVALVKINTTDWNEPSVKYSGFRPTAYNTVIKANTQLNVITGLSANPQDIAISAAVVTYEHGDANPKELNYEYLFANADSSILPDFTVNYTKSANLIADYTFSNIPVQRNYQTNITGNILTKLGDIYVTLDGTWNSPHKEIQE